MYISEDNPNDLYVQLEKDFADKYLKVKKELAFLSSKNNISNSCEMSKSTLESIMDMLNTIKCLLELEEFRDKFTMLETLNDMQLKYETCMIEIEQKSRALEEKTQELLILKEYIADNWANISNFVGMKKSKTQVNLKLVSQKENKDDLMVQILDKNEKLQNENERISTLSKHLENKIIEFEENRIIIKRENKTYQKELYQMTQNKNIQKKDIAILREEKKICEREKKELKEYSGKLEIQNRKLEKKLRKSNLSKSSLEDECKKLNFSMDQINETLNHSVQTKEKLDVMLGEMQVKHQRKIKSLENTVDILKNDPITNLISCLNKMTDLNAVICVGEETISLYENNQLLKENIILNKQINKLIETDDEQHTLEDQKSFLDLDEGIMLFANPFPIRRERVSNGGLELKENSPRRKAFHIRNSTDPQKLDVNLEDENKTSTSGDKIITSQHEKKISLLNADEPIVIQRYYGDEDEEEEEEDENNAWIYTMKSPEKPMFTLGQPPLKKSLTPIPEYNKTGTNLGENSSMYESIDVDTNNINYSNNNNATSFSSDAYLDEEGAVFDILLNF